MMDEVLWSSVGDLLDSRLGARAATRISDQTDGSFRGPTSLLDYGAYFDLELVPPAEEEVPPRAKAEALEYLQRRLVSIGAAEPVVAPPRITNFSTEHYTLEQLERIRRWLDIEPANRMAMTHVSEEEFGRTSSAIEVAMSHLRDAAPELHGEIQTVVRDFILSKPDGTNLVNYSGASSFALFGAFTINAETQVEWTQNYRQIVHEAGHNLLFAIACEEPLVTDDPSIRTDSPIRADPRPMDGIFHAAFVSAREAYAFDVLLSLHEVKDHLDPGDAQILEELLGMSVVAFWQARETLRSHAQLTELGDAVLSDCEAYMSANFAVEPLEQ